MLSNEEVDEIGEEYARKMYERFPNNSLCVDIEGLATDVLGLTIIYESFCGKDTDKIGFLADGCDSITISRDGKPHEVIFPWKTVVIDKYLLNVSQSGRKRFTIAHEVAHYLIERMNPLYRKARAHREFDNDRDYTCTELSEVFAFPENRADKLAAALMMPRFNVEKALDRFAEGHKFCVYGRNIIVPEDKIRMQVMADGMGVSYSALRIRLKELGFIENKTFDELVEQDFQEGDFDDSDIEYDRSLGRLTPERTYLIHRSRRESERLENRKLECPVCGFPMTTIDSGNNGYMKLKCRKCKLESPFGVSYFRTQKRPATPERPMNYKVKNKNQR